MHDITGFFPPVKAFAKPQDSSSSPRWPAGAGLLNTLLRVGRALLGAAVLLGFAGALARGQTVFFDFNAVGQYTNQFNPWNDAGGANGGNYSFEENPSAGVGGSGGVSVFQSTDTTATYTNGSWDFSTNGASLTISALVQANGQTSGNKVQLGIINSNNNGLNNNPGVAFESFRFIPQSATSLSLREQFRTGGALTENNLGTITTTVGEWYKFVITLTNTSGATGGYNAACAIEDYGADGLTPGTNIVTFPTLMSHAGQTDVTVPVMWAAFRAFQNGGINAWDNFLVYTPASRPVITVALTNTSVALGQPANFVTLAEGPGPMSYAWYTNDTLVTGAAGASYTTPAVNSSYNKIAVVAGNANGSVTNSAAITVFVPSVASVTNLPASAIQTTAATLNGQVLSTGGQAPNITLFYGPNDGGTNPQAWSNSVALGAQSASFSQRVTGLVPNTTYQFTARAINSVGASWAVPSLSFTTLPILPAAITNLPATVIEATAATLNGQVLDSGNDAPAITFYYGTSDGGTNAAAWSQSVAVGVQTGVYAQTVTGLSSNTTYFFTAAAVNGAGTSWANLSQSFTTPATNPPLPAGVAVLTQHNDNNRSGENLQETQLTTSHVNTNEFGLLVSRPVDDQVYAQPLIMTNVNLPGLGVHNLLIVASVNDTIYAYDADDATRTAPYWTDSFISPPNIVAPNNADESAAGACGGNYQDFSGKFGIVGTPVIDPAAGTLYVVVRTKEFGTSFVQRLHALDLATGLDRSNSPVVIGATYPGTGDGSSGGILTFDPLRNNQRPALTLVNGVVYISWSSHCDNGPYHGWVIGYDAGTLQQVAVYNDTPNGSEAGIWMSGQGPCADAAGNLYLSTGNGTVDASDYGESFVKIAPTNSGSIMNVAGFFTPLNWSSLNGGDVDLGSGGLLLIPGTSLAISGGKQSVLYLVSRDNLGGISAGLQSWSLNAGQIHGGPVWWTGPSGSFLYVWADSGGHLAQFQFNGSTFNTTPTAQSAMACGSGSPGGVLALSANGTNAGSGILWAVVNTSQDANQAVVPGTLHAFNAQNVGSELWNSDLVARDSLGNLAKFVAPTVANGKVYMATFSGRVNVYGLKASSTPAQLSVSPSGLSFGAVTVGQTNTRTFQLVNTGGLTLTGTVATAAPFKISAGSPFSLASSQTGLVQVAFNPGSAGSFSNVVTFTSNGGDSTNPVTGSGVTQPQPQLSVSPAALNFGTLAVGSNAQSSFALTNSGAANLTNGVAAIQGAGPFSIVSGTPFALAGFGTTNLVIRFAPGNAGSFSNLLVITSDGGNSTNALLGASAVVPGAAFSAAPTSGAAPLTVSFTDTSSGTITNRSWDFGDSTTTNTTAAAVTHQYLTAGTNTVHLTVSGPVGNDTLTRAAYIIVTNLGPVTLAVQPVGSQLQLTWPAGTLQSAQQVTGPYTNVLTTSPFIINPSNASQFFRVKVR